jgi:hypothetical protein
MDIQQKNQVHQHQSDHMIRGLLIVAIVVVIRDSVTGESGWFWHLIMLGVTTALLIFKVIVFSERKAFVRFRQTLFAWIE